MLDFECKAKYEVGDFRRLIACLRGEDGCPWDRVQTHASIRRNLLEEAYEVCEAIDEGDPAHLCEELGDLLMQVIFHARIEEEAGRFDLNDVADAACHKLVLRHPHVFGDVQVADAEEVLRNWDDIKRREKAQKTTSDAMDGVAETLPALWRAEKIQKKAKKVGFDMTSAAETVDKLREETAELQAAMESGNEANILEELGDLLFSVVNVARFVDVDPEKALHLSCEKFIRRFRYVEEEARKAGRRPEDMTLDELEALYQRGRREREGRSEKQG